MIYRIKLRNKETKRSIWVNVVSYTKKGAIRKTVAALVYSNIYDLFEIRKVKKVIYNE